MPKTKHLYFDLQASWDSNTCATANRAYCPPELTSLHAVLYILTRKSGRVAWSWISTNEKTPNLQSLCKTTLQYSGRLSYWITRCMSELLSSYIAVIHLLALSGWKTSAIQINLILGMLPGLIFFSFLFLFSCMGFGWGAVSLSHVLAVCYTVRLLVWKTRKWQRFPPCKKSFYLILICLFTSLKLVKICYPRVHSHFGKMRTLVQFPSQDTGVGSSGCWLLTLMRQHLFFRHFTFKS